MSGEGNASGASALLFACALENYDAAATLVRRGADPNAQTVDGITALAYAHQLPEDLLHLLLDAGADPNHDMIGLPPLLLAAFFGSTRAVTVLLKHGADVNKRTPAGNTALTEAALGKHPDVVKLLLTAGADASVAANPAANWAFVATVALEMQRESKEALERERAAHRATEAGFHFALPHLLAASSGLGKRPRQA